MRRFSPLLLLGACAVSGSLGVAGALFIAPSSPVAEGQASATPQGRYILATCPNQKGTTECYVLDVESSRLAVYTSDRNGVKYLGTREITYDMVPQNLDPKGKRLYPKDVRAVVDP